MADAWDQTVRNDSWELNLSKDFNDWEVDLVVALLSSLQKERVSYELDKISWKGLAGCTFSISEAVKVLNSRVTPLFPIKSIWVHFVPTNAAFFAWEAAYGKVLTLDKLQRRGWQLPNRCYLCGHHILLHCPVVNHFWDLFFSLVGLYWVFPKTIKDALLSWNGYFVGKNRRYMWKFVPLCIFWIVWKERNLIAFRDGTVDVQKLKHSFVYKLWSWNSLFIGEEISSLTGFLDWVAASLGAGVVLSASFCCRPFAVFFPLSGSFMYSPCVLLGTFFSFI